MFKNYKTLLLKIVNNDQDLYLESSEDTYWRGHDWKFLANLLVHMVDGYILLEHVHMVTSTALHYRVNHHIYHFSVGWGIGSKILWEKLGWYVLVLLMNLQKYRWCELGMYFYGNLPFLIFIWLLSRSYLGGNSC